MFAGCHHGDLCVVFTVNRDGEWGSYGPWTECDCADTRMRYRERHCDSPEPLGDGASCSGASKMVSLSLYMTQFSLHVHKVA